jgi:amidophosphoribosyltransferase
VPRRPEHATAVSIDTHPSAADGVRHPAELSCISDEDPGFHETSTGCDPGPDSDLEELLLPEDRRPAPPADQHETAKDA